jgi:hypothetical protein
MPARTAPPCRSHEGRGPKLRGCRQQDANSSQPPWGPAAAAAGRPATRARRCRLRRRAAPRLLWPGPRRGQRAPCRAERAAAHRAGAPLAAAAAAAAAAGYPGWWRLILGSRRPSAPPAGRLLAGAAGAGAPGGGRAPPQFASRRPLSEPARPRRHARRCCAAQRGRDCGTSGGWRAQGRRRRCCHWLAGRWWLLRCAHWAARRGGEQRKMRCPVERI